MSLTVFFFCGYLWFTHTYLLQMQNQGGSSYWWPYSWDYTFIAP